MKVNPLVQIEALLAHGGIHIERTGMPCEYEVTTYFGNRVAGDHAHHGGATLAEAVNRAMRALPNGCKTDG